MYWGSVQSHILCSVKALKSKLKAATESSEHLSDIYNALTDSMDPVDVEQWRRDEAHAMSVRGDALNIFDVPLMKGL